MLCRHGSRGSLGSERLLPRPVALQMSDSHRVHTTHVDTRTVHTADGRQLCVEIAGEPSDRTILVHNGTPNSRHLYPGWISDASSRRARLISYDRPGYGGSTADPGYSIADSAAGVRAIADARRAQRRAVWGVWGRGAPAPGGAGLPGGLVVAGA